MQRSHPRTGSVDPNTRSRRRTANHGDKTTRRGEEISRRPVEIMRRGHQFFGRGMQLTRRGDMFTCHGHEIIDCGVQIFHRRHQILRRGVQIIGCRGPQSRRRIGFLRRKQLILRVFAERRYRREGGWVVIELTVTHALTAPCAQLFIHHQLPSAFSHPHPFSTCRSNRARSPRTVQ